MVDHLVPLERLGQINVVTLEVTQGKILSQSPTDATSKR